MKSFPFRLVATLLLGGQMLPHGLPLLCDQVRRGTPADCEQMPPSPSHPVVGATTDGAPCINAALCAATATAVIALGIPAAVPASESRAVRFGVPTFAPADPQPPLPPPPLA